ncbi:OB-fold domain-containing protein [Paraburkholderia phymatum]|uniref:Zn-ribbon domain-containing OB-fold protein n=1 Tax=Paraburkholderia phymatum TaxID=148447 RepID=UPI00316E6068
MEFETPIVPQANPGLSADYLRSDGTGVHLIGQHCEDCGKALFPKTGICPGCQSERVVDVALPAHGTLYSWSVVHVAPKPWVTPYVIGYVDLSDTVRVFSHIGGDPQVLRVDMPVRLHAATPVSEERPAGTPLFTFNPVAGENA